MTEKRCTRCSTPKPLDAFSRDRQKPDGLCSRCKACQREHVSLLPRRSTTAASKKCGACKETKESPRFVRRSLSSDGLSNQCKDCFRDYFIVWSAKNAASISVKAKVRSRRWHVENPLGSTLSKLRRRARGGAELSVRIIRSIIADQAGICLGCRLLLAGSFHIDHIVPISKGGTSARENLQALHPRCNLVKGAKLPHVWIRETRPIAFQ